MTSSSVVGAVAVVDTSNVLTGGILLCFKKVKGIIKIRKQDTYLALALFTCVRLIPRLLAIKQQIYICKKTNQFITVFKNDVMISVL